MKRFLRYVLYREVYTWLRNIRETDESSSSRSLDTGDGISSQQQSRDIPLEEGAIESIDDLQAVLQQMDPYEFEHFVADLWERMEWDTTVSSASTDKGVDVIAKKDTPYEQTVLIQAKRYGPNTTVGSPDIQQYASLRHQYDGVDKVLIVTTNEFTSQARELADQLNVKLIDGTDLAELVVGQDALDLIDEYLDFVTTTEPDDTSDQQHPAATATETPAPAADTDTDTDTRSAALPATVWEKAILAAIPGWLIAFFGVTVLPDSIWGVLFFTVWFGLPVAIYLDAQHVQDHINWPTRTWAYILTSLIWLFAIIPAGLYLWRRRSIGASDADEPTESAHDSPSTDHSPLSSSPSGTSATETDSSEPRDQPAQNPPSTQETGNVSTADRALERMDIEYKGERYYAQTTPSPDGTYTAAYQDGRSGGGQGEPQLGRVFLFEDGDEELCFTTEIARPNACAVANTGTVAVVDWNLDWGDELSGTFYVFDRDGHLLVTHEFDANLGPVAITPDGAYAATSTLNPDCSTYLFDVEAGELLLRHENKEGNVQHLEFVDRDGERMLRLGEPDDDSAYGIDFGGHVVWKSEGLKRQHRLDRLLESSDEADLHEAIELLTDALELADEEYEQRDVAQRLADAHWKLARSIEQENGITNEWWTHLDHAADYYSQALPRYAGKQGVAKVKRKQGKQHLDNGDKEAAQQCFKEIADLEDEYDVQLLTNADERRLKELQSSR